MYWPQQGHAVPCITFPIAAPNLYMLCEGHPTSMPELHAAGTTQEVYTEIITAPKTKPFQSKPQQGFYAVTQCPASKKGEGICCDLLRLGSHHKKS